MSNIRLQGNPSGTGTLTIASPNTNSDFTFNLPAANGTIPVLSSVTNNGVVFVNSSGQATSGSALTFDGTNLSVGTTSFISRFNVEGNVSLLGGNRLFLWNTANTAAPYIRNVGGSDLGFFDTSDGERMRLTSTGLGIGTTSPTSRLEVIGGEIRWGAGPSVGALSYTGGAPVVAAIGANPLLLFTNGSERARIDSSGNFLFATTNATVSSSTGFRAFPSGEIASTMVASTNGGGVTYTTYSTGAGALRFYVGMGGTVFATSTSISAISDASLKENVRDLETGLSEVMALRPRRFDWKQETQIGEKDVAGFIAQEVEQVLPELVYDYQYNADTVKKSVKMGDILPTLVKAIQEQQAIIEQLTTRIAALEAQ